MNSLYIAFNLFKRVLGNKNGWISFILLPSVILSLIVFFVGKEPSKTVDIVYANLDEGMLGSYVLKELSAKESYHLVEMEPNQLREEIKSQRSPVGFILHEQFTEDIMAGRKPIVEKFELSLSEASFTLELSVNQVINQLARSVDTVNQIEADEAKRMTTITDLLDRQVEHHVKAIVVAEKTYISDQLFLVVGFILFFLMGQITSTIGFVLDDRRQLTMARIFSTPVRSFEITLGNLLGSLSIGLLQLIVVLTITKYVFGFNYGVPFLPLFATLVAYLLAAVGIASAVAGVVRNSSNLGAVNSLVITPTCMIGGCWWPISVMPEFMQKLANFVPQKWAIEGVTKMAAGGSLFTIGMELGILLLFGIVFLGFGSVVLRPSEEVS